MNRSIDISYKTIIFIAVFIALVWVTFLIRDVIILLFVAIIFMSALSPVVQALEKIKIPKSLAIALCYIVILSTVALLLSFVLTPLLDQTVNLVTNLPQYSSRLLPEDGPINRTVIQQELGNVSRNALTFTLEIFSNFVAFISVAVLTFYLLLERKRLDHLITQFAIGHEARAKRVTQKIEEKLGAWVRGQIALSLIIGLAAYIALSLLHVPYALPLAILAGIFEVVPVIGPIISSVPAILVALLISPLTALYTGLAFFIIQQAENHFVVPQVMKQAVGLNPLIVILAVAIGGRLLGISGALLAVPITVVIQIVTEDILRHDNA